MAPRPRHGWRPGFVPDQARQAAGLILIYPHDGCPHLVLTVRAGHLASHANQVSLPGGAVEADETVTEAALREAAEEIGVDPTRIQVLGALSTIYVPVSDFALHPVVGTTGTRPTFRPAASEVERILEVSLETLDASGPRRGYRWRGTDRFDVPYFELRNERVWGVTAMILAELLAVMARPAADPWLDDTATGD